MLVLAIDQFFEFWLIFSSFNLGFFKAHLLPQFCSDPYQILTGGVPSGPPFGFCFFFFLFFFLAIYQFFQIFVNIFVFKNKEAFWHLVSISLG